MFFLFFLEQKGCAAAAGSTRGGAAAHVNSAGNSAGRGEFILGPLWMLLCHVASPALRRGSFPAQDPIPWKGWESIWEGHPGLSRAGCADGNASGWPKGWGMVAKPAEGAAVGCLSRCGMGLSQLSVYPCALRAFGFSSRRGAALRGGRMLLTPRDGARLGMAA